MLVIAVVLVVVGVTVVRVTMVRSSRVRMCVGGGCLSFCLPGCLPLVVATLVHAFLDIARFCRFRFG